MIFQRIFFALAALFVTTVTFEGGVAAAEQQRRQVIKSSKKNRPTPSPVITEKGFQHLLSVIEQIGADPPELPLLGGGRPNKFAVDGGIIDLLMGYSIVDQEKGNIAFEPIRNCVDDDITACIEKVISSEQSRSTQATIYDESTRSSFMKAAISAEGGSVGVTVSASVEVMTTSEMSLESVSHIVSGTTYTHNKRIRNAQKLKLTEPAKDLLNTDRERFIRQFGLTFVQSITEGGSFMGTFNMVAKKSSSQQELKAEASFKYEGGVYSAKGSATFEGRQKEETSNTRITAEWKGTPDPYLSSGNRGEISSPAQMMRVYGNWSETVKDTPAPIFLETNAYSVSEDVQSILQKLDDTDSTVKAIEGSVLSISPVTMEMATTELVDTVLLIKALDTYTEWEEVKKYKDTPDGIPFYKKLEELSRDANLYRVARTTSTIYNDASLVALNRQLVNNLFYDPEIKNNGNRFGSWRYFSQRDREHPGLQQRFDDDIKPGIEKLTRLKCLPQAQGNDPDQFIPGMNLLVNRFGDPRGYCPAHYVCRDEVDENGKAVLVQDKMKICVPVYRCKDSDKVTGDGKNCFNHPSPGKAGCYCSANAYCDPAVESFNYNEPPMCKTYCNPLTTACK